MTILDSGEVMGTCEGSGNLQIGKDSRITSTQEKKLLFICSYARPNQDEAYYPNYQVLNWPTPSMYERNPGRSGKETELEIEAESDTMLNNRDESQSKTEQDFVKIFVTPLIIVIFFLFLFSCCLFCVFKKIMTNYLSQDEVQEEE